MKMLSYNKKRPYKAIRISVLAIALSSALSFGGCRPANYTSDAKKQVLKAHEGSAQEWFDRNIPGAKVKSAGIYTNGMDILCIIEGKYKTSEGTYSYKYDYYNDEMYSDRLYDETYDKITGIVADELAVERSQVDILPFRITIETGTENTPGTTGEMSHAYVDGFLPIDIDPDEYAKTILKEASDERIELLLCSVYVYDIPSYDAGIFERMKGLLGLTYVRPADTETDDMIYSASYDKENAHYDHLVMKKTDSGSYVGFTYEVHDTYDENGGLTEHTDQIDGKDPVLMISAESNGNIVFRIPEGKATPLVLAKKNKEYRGKAAETQDRYFVWDEALNLGDKGYFEGEYTYYSDHIVFPVSGLELYSHNRYSDETGTYSFYKDDHD
ncbi:MAG: hypothetical protein K6G12_00160 [Lachnospiraceae bacterium]|nr:hypothetical protein [Lachnospiraceae bacterium]